jgi:hypothetical protein
LGYSYPRHLNSAYENVFHSTLIARQYLSSHPANITVLPQTFSKHNEATTNKFSRLLFILEQVKIVPNGRFLLLSSACRSKQKKQKTKNKKAEKRMKGSSSKE